MYAVKTMSEIKKSESIPTQIKKEPKQTDITFIQTDNQFIVNEQCIRWIKKVHDCMQICAKPGGCVSSFDTLRVCKMNSPDSYDRLNNYFMKTEKIE